MVIRANARLTMMVMRVVESRRARRRILRKQINRRAARNSRNASSALGRNEDTSALQASVIEVVDTIVERFE